MATKFHFINNEFIEGSSASTYAVHNPADDTLVGNINLARETEVDAAVSAARAAFESGPWSTMKGAERGVLLNKLADLIQASGDELAKAEAQAMGQPVAANAAVVLPLGVGHFRYIAGWADKIEGQTWPVEDGWWRYTQYEPYGVCAGIGPWNVSLLTFAWKVGTALATGNTVVYKNSEKTPYGVLVLARLVKEAGFPPGVVNIVSGDGVTGSLLAHHMDIDKISFTGSGPSGQKVLEAAAKSNNKKVTLELGGKSPSLVFEDANLDNALVMNSDMFLFNNAQACIAASRLFVQSSIADKFIEGLKARFEGAVQAIGDPSAPTTMQGPLADLKQLERVLGYIEAGKSEGTLAVGGARHGDTGAFVKPTIFLNPSKTGKIYREEIFGPVLVISTFETEEEAIEMANDTSYGLSACVYTGSTSRALRVASKIKAGTIGVNGAFAPDNNTPFGGYKQSGIGRELGKEGLYAYLQAKSVRVNMNV
ncbi:aldehyde dehydrogenase [Massarina eburnea CBS 473.64]|uniref:aldehyde dehydrogenase (NAD(+)) n=1 Tax=Massarina eburnea CBS 473.64 TaxID=1395130 RepID=A0A6A6S0G3_9PLEO|nr:aldehyde dehydrogenase [Massarina eburnea CBS 473.64]